MKVQINQSGVFGTDGKEIPKGETLAIKGDRIPAWLLGKCDPVERVAVTNPAEGAVPSAAPPKK